MSGLLFRDEWVSVSPTAIECKGASYQVRSVAGVRLAAVRETAFAKVIGFAALLVVCDFAACSVAIEAFRMPLLGALGVAGASLGWAYSWAPETYYVILNLGGAEVALVRYAKKIAALACIEGIEAAVNASPYIVR